MAVVNYPAAGGSSGPSYSTSSVTFPDDNAFVPFALRRVGDMVFLNLEQIVFASLAPSAGTPAKAAISVDGIAGLVPTGFMPDATVGICQIPFNYSTTAGAQGVGLIYITAPGFGNGKIFIYKDLSSNFFDASVPLNSLTMVTSQWLTEQAVP